MGEKIMNDLFKYNVKSLLQGFIEKNDFKFLALEELEKLGIALKQYEYEQRGITVLFLKNKKFILEIFSDPQGGEVHCKIAKSEEVTVNHSSWKYFYELFPLNTIELSKIKISQGSMEAQFAVLMQKLTETDLTS